MELNGYVDELHHHVLSAAQAIGGDAPALAERLVVPLDAAVRLVLLDALSTAAAEITTTLAPGAVDVRLRGRDPEFVVTAPVTPTFAAADEAAPPAAGTHREPVAVAPAVTDDVSTTRTTLRLPDQLKAQAEAAAVRDGVSVNTWLVRAVAAALEPSDGPPPPGTAPAVSDGQRIVGWAR